MRDEEEDHACHNDTVDNSNIVRLSTLRLYRKSYRMKPAEKLDVEPIEQEIVHSCFSLFSLAER
jgi:hypothetical protein